MRTGRTVNNRGDRTALDDVTLVAVDARGNPTPCHRPLTVTLRRRQGSPGGGGGGGGAVRPSQADTPANYPVLQVSWWWEVVGVVMYRVGIMLERTRPPCSQTPFLGGGDGTHVE